eukprot:9491119-Pyramimonas_sp.AAC.1
MCGSPQLKIRMRWCGSTGGTGVSHSGPSAEGGLFHWRFRWSSLWGHETCEGCAAMGRHRHADPAAAAFGGAASGHEACEGCAKMWGGITCGRSLKGAVRPSQQLRLRRS